MEQISSDVADNRSAIQETPCRVCGIQSLTTMLTDTRRWTHRKPDELSQHPISLACPFSIAYSRNTLIPYCEGSLAPAQYPSWRMTPCRLSVTVYS